MIIDPNSGEAAQIPDANVAGLTDAEIAEKIAQAEQDRLIAMRTFLSPGMTDAERSLADLFEMAQTRIQHWHDISTAIESQVADLERKFSFSTKTEIIKMYKAIHTIGQMNRDYLFQATTAILLSADIINNVLRFLESHNFTPQFPNTQAFREGLDNPEQANAEEDRTVSVAGQAVIDEYDGPPINDQ